jgi:outer membrane lipoprotein-sorting protein
MNIVAAAASLAVLVLGQPQPPAPAAPPPTVAELDAKAADITSLKAEFQREKHSDLLLEPLISSGRITAREGEGGGVRWDTLEPRPSTVIIAGGKVIAREGEGAAEAYDIPESLARLTASPRLQFSALEDAFAITVARGPGADVAAAEGDGQREAAQDAPDAERILLTLTPSDEQVRRFVEWVKVELDPETAVATRIEYADPDGDRTVLRFTKVQINPEVSESLFDPDKLRP